MISLEFLITALVVVLSPGTGVIYTLAVGLGRGRVQSMAAALGCTLGIVPHILAAILGFAALLHTSALVFTVFKIAGAAYLVYLAVQVLRSKGSLSFEPDPTPRSLLATAKTGFLINILNPKLSIFFLAFLPQFAPTGEPNAIAHMAVLSAVFMAMTFVVFVVYGAFAALARTYVLASKRVMSWVRRVTALAFGAMGAKLVMSQG